MRPPSRACPTSSEPVVLQPDRPGFYPSYSSSFHVTDPITLLTKIKDISFLDSRPRGLNQVDIPDNILSIPNAATFVSAGLKTPSARPWSKMETRRFSYSWRKDTITWRFSSLKLLISE